MAGKIDTKTAPKRYEVLAHELRARIISGEFSEGAQFPGEMELVLQTGRSRSSVREALRVLESEGLLSKKTAGRYGGSTVQRASEHTIQRQLDLFIRGRSLSFQDLLRTRQAIEPMLAWLAAQNRTTEDLAEIAVLNDGLADAIANDHSRIVVFNTNWHLAVARASHNELLNALMIGISGVIRKASAVGEHGSPDMRTNMLKAHRRITDAIEQQDAEAARRRMARHLGAYEQELARFVKPAFDL